MLIESIIRGKSHDVATTTLEALVTDVAAILYENRIGIIVVCSEGGRVLGVLSERDIVRAVSQWPEHLPTLQVSQLYTEDPITCTLKDETAEVMAIMNEKKFRHMPVVEHGSLIGVISIGDLLKSRIDEAGAVGQEKAWGGLDFL